MWLPNVKYLWHRLTLISIWKRKMPSQQAIEVKMHTYIVPLEVHGHLICRMLYITSSAGILHPTLVWRFQEATNISMQGGALTCLPSNAEWGEALSIWDKGVLNPSYLSFESGQSWTQNLSHMSLELYHCTTEAVILKEQYGHHM